MTIEHKFLITYGLQNFVTHAKSGKKHVFIINQKESQIMVNHAKSLIKGSYGIFTKIQMA